MKTDTLIMIAAVAVVLGWGGKTVVDMKNASDTEKHYAPIIAATEQQFGIPAGLLHRLIKQESAFRQDIISGKKRSPVGALGIAQFMPATAQQELGSVNAALDPAKAIPGAARYLKKLHAALGTWEKAVAAYNWGIGNVQRKGLANAPRETRNYVAAVYYGQGKTA